MFRDALANDRNREAKTPLGQTSRFRRIPVLDNRSRMRFLESAPRRRISRRENAAKRGLEPSSLFFPPLLILLANSRRGPLSRSLGRIGPPAKGTPWVSDAHAEFANGIRCYRNPGLRDHQRDPEGP